MRINIFKLFYIVNSLAFSNKKMPWEPKPRRYKFNKHDPCQDLKILSHNEISFVSKNWMINEKLKNNKNSEELVNKCNNIEKSLQNQHLKTYPIDIYFAWCPKGEKKDILYLIVGELNCEKSLYNHNINILKEYVEEDSPGEKEIREIFDETFLENEFSVEELLEWDEISKNNLYTEKSDNLKNINIKLLLPSPFWQSDQIGSVYLKNSLDNLSLKAYGNNANFSQLYENDIRYKLSWSR